MGHRSASCLALVVSAVLAGCVMPPPSQGAQIVRACSSETGVVGSYDFDGNKEIPVVTPIAGNRRLVGGTSEGAAQLNACIRTKAATGLGSGGVVRASTPPSARSGGMDAFATQCMFEVTVPSGSGKQAGIAAMNACISRKAAEAGYAPSRTAASAPVNAALPKVAGVQQSVQVNDLGNGRSVETFTYGTPPSSAPRRVSNPRPTPGCIPGAAVLQGGAGYCIGN